MTIHKTQQEAIDAFEKEHKGEIVNFDGQNCNDYLEDNEPECDGWEVGEKRCECGNRRVYLTTFGDSTSGFTAYACAN